MVQMELPFAGKLTCLSGAPPASRSASQESGKASTGQAGLPTTLSGFCGKYGLDGSSGRTSRARFQAGRMDNTTSTSSSGSMLNAGMAWRGEYLTLNMCEHNAFHTQSPSEDAVCSLSDVLETGSVPERYYLTMKACQGILRRAERRGKELPPVLKEALERQAGGCGTEAVSIPRSTSPTGEAAG